MAPARVVYSRAPPENPRGARLGAAPPPPRVPRLLARRAMMAASLQRVTGWCAPSGAERRAVSRNGVAEGLRPFLSVDKPAFRELSRKVKILGQHRPLCGNCDRPGASARYSKKPGKSLPDQRAIERA